MSIDRNSALWQMAATNVLARWPGESPRAAAGTAIAYADALLEAIDRQEREDTAAARESASRELEEVRARFPLGSMAKCTWGTAPVVRVAWGIFSSEGKITVSIFQERDPGGGGSGITLPHTEFTPVPPVGMAD